MKYFIDTEFIEGFHKPLFGKRRHFIDLISIGIVSGDGREYYAISNEFNPGDADKWVQDNVISLLDPKNVLSTRNNGGYIWRNNAMIANDVQGFCMAGGIEPIEFYGYYCDYDWVLFCSLFGRMIDLPKGFPMYCRDLKQYFDDMQDLSKYDLKLQPDYPKQKNEHNALADAWWNVKLYKFLQKVSKENL